MVALRIVNWESDGAGGFYIEWFDPENLDGGPLTGYTHLTVALCDDLIRAHRRSRGAPDGLLSTVRDALVSDTPPDGRQVVEAFRRGYGELIEDRKALHRYGLRADTPHRVLTAVKEGGEVPAEWVQGPSVEPGMDRFVTQSTTS